MKPLFLVLSAAPCWPRAATSPSLSAMAARAMRRPGPARAAFTAPGWKVGDKTSWEGEMRARTQYGQNEYTRNGN
jgi:hypothetical protein